MDTQQLIVAGLATFAVATLGIVFVEPLLTGDAEEEVAEDAQGASRQGG